MKWDPPSIVRYATDAGFAPPALHTAVAIALAASNGVDNCDFATGIPGTGRYVGLWGINTDEWPEYAPDAMKRPSEAATAAHELTTRLGNFGWSAVWRAGSERRWLGVAATASTRLPWGEIQHATIGLHVAQRVIDAMGHRLKKVGQHGNKL